MILRRASAIVHIQRLVGVSPRQIQRHAQGNFRISDILHLVHDLFATLCKFLLELRHQRLGALRIHLLKRRARVMRHAVSHYGDRCHHGQHKNQQ